jgi:pyrophosphatase PpaX
MPYIEKIKLLIFDYDGTIRTLSFEGVYQGYQAIVRQIMEKNPEDFWADINEFREWFNPFWPENLRRLNVDFGEEVDDVFREQYAKYTCIFSWAEEVLRFISKNNQLAICSTAPSKKIREELGKLAPLFSLIVGANDVKNIKPDPEGIHIILKYFGVSPEKAIIIGDSECDIEAGKAAGVKTGIVNWGLAWNYGKQKEILALQPDYIFSSAKQFNSFF